MKFLNSKLVILVLSFSQWLGCLSAAFLIDKNTFLNLYFGILSRLSPFCTYSLRINAIYYINNMRKPVKAAS
jgi:hypothetical protein